MEFIARKPEGACPKAECNKCHASRVVRVIIILYPEAMATIVIEFVSQEDILLATRLLLSLGSQGVLCRL